ncbi:MAG: hypothetical protein JW892_07380 [Anaerolineae bacterium]|nr:hypothetical protein [Anaerolineae bacterium]
MKWRHFRVMLPSNLVFSSIEGCQGHIKKLAAMDKQPVAAWGACLQIALGLDVHPRLTWACPAMPG